MVLVVNFFAFVDHANIVQLLIDGGTNSISQIAKIEEDLHKYRIGSIPHQGITYDQYVKQLAKNVDNFNAVNGNGNNALHFAVKHGYTNVAQFLSDRGVNVNHINNSGNSSLLINVFEGFFLCI